MSKDEIIAKKEGVISNLRDENKQLKQELSTLKNLIFGAKSDRYKTEIQASQLNLFSESAQEIEVEQAEEQSITYKRKKKSHPGRNKLPEHLPVEEIIIEPDQSVEGLKKVGEEVSETLKYTPASLVKLRTIRPKYEKPNQEGILIGSLPHRPIHKCIAESSLLAYILVAKFVDHLPFYRLIKGFKRDFDWEVSSSTINDWFIACCTLLQPVYDQMVEVIQQSTYIQVDESPIKVLESEKKKQSHQGYQWVYHSPQAKVIVFQYRKGRGMHGPKEMLENYKGYLQCDGYSVYDKIGKSKNVQLVGCLAHARRYFHQALDNDKQKAEYALSVFSKIYNLERQWKGIGKDKITINRRKETLPSLEKLKSWCEDQSIKVLPKSSIGKAMTYYQKQYAKLESIVLDGKLEVDNNLIENKIRPLALGRKNYLFAGNHQAGQRIAMMYSFFSTCKAKDVNPKKWLETTLNTLADPDFEDFKSLIP